MCYGQVHDCTVTCINGYLNTTALKDGIVTSVGDFNRCSIICAEGVPIDTGSNLAPGLLGISIWMLILAVIIFGLILVYLLNSIYADLHKDRGM